MAKAVDYTKLRRLLKIYLVVQVFLFVILVFMAFYLQVALQAAGLNLFMKSVVITLVMQLALFYPISKFAKMESKREIEAAAPDLDADQLKALRTRRMISDVVKSGVFIFFLSFTYLAPKNPFLQSVVFFTFILTYLSYFQCLTFAIKRGIPDSEKKKIPEK